MHLHSLDAAHQSKWGIYHDLERPIKSYIYHGLECLEPPKVLNLAWFGASMFSRVFYLSWFGACARIIQRTVSTLVWGMHTFQSRILIMLWSIHVLQNIVLAMLFSINDLQNIVLPMVWSTHTFQSIIYSLQFERSEYYIYYSVDAPCPPQYCIPHSLEHFGTFWNTHILQSNVLIIVWIIHTVQNIIILALVRRLHTFQKI